MDLKTAVARARRGLREERRLYVVAISSLTVAFLCLGTALLAIENLSELAARWGQSGRLTVYLRDGATADDVQGLRSVLEGLDEVEAVNHVTATEARTRFLEHASIDAELGALPPEVFPASLEVGLIDNVPVQRSDAIAARVARFGVVDDVESYKGWFARLESLLAAGRGVASALALLVVVCVLAVVGNTIRLAVAGRRREIEVMKLCGATDSFVRGPFILEGAFQGALSVFLALALLLIGFVALRGSADETFAALTGVEIVFLGPAPVVLLLVGGAVVGAAGSAWSLRRYLGV